MKPIKIQFYVYGEEGEDKALNEALYAFIEEKRKDGIAVTAKALISALNNFKNNIFLNGYLRKYGN